MKVTSKVATFSIRNWLGAHWQLAPAKNDRAPKGRAIKTRLMSIEQRLTCLALEHLNRLVQLFVLLRRLLLVFVCRSGVLVIVGKGCVVVTVSEGADVHLVDDGTFPPEGFVGPGGTGTGM